MHCVYIRTLSFITTKYMEVVLQSVSPTVHILYYSILYHGNSTIIIQQFYNV